MCSLGRHGEGELRGQPANPGLPGKWPLKRNVCMCMCTFSSLAFSVLHSAKMFPGEPGLAGFPLNSLSPFLPKLRILGQA